MGTVYSVLGAGLLLWGLGFGTYKWIVSATHNAVASSGTVMFAALPIILGIQFLIAFLHIDIDSVPREALSHTLDDDATPLPKADAID